MASDAGGGAMRDVWCVKVACGRNQVALFRRAPTSPPHPVLGCPFQERRAPAGVALRARLLSLFCKSAAAANCFPHSLTVRRWAAAAGLVAQGERDVGSAWGNLSCKHASGSVPSLFVPPTHSAASTFRRLPSTHLLHAQTVTVCLYGAQTTPRLRQAGMEFAVWVFKHAEPAQLAPAAASILDSCLQLLDDGAWLGRRLRPGPRLGCLPRAQLLGWLTALGIEPHPSPARRSAAASTRGGDVGGLTLRGFTYQAVGQLAQRQPQAFAGRLDIATRWVGLGWAGHCPAALARLLLAARPPTSHASPTPAPMHPRPPGSLRLYPLSPRACGRRCRRRHPAWLLPSGDRRLWCW